MKHKYGPQEKKQFIKPPIAMIFINIFMSKNMVKNPRNPDTTTIINHQSILGLGIMNFIGGMRAKNAINIETIYFILKKGEDFNPPPDYYCPAVSKIVGKVLPSKLITIHPTVLLTYNNVIN